jgi:hypothetical protein
MSPTWMASIGNVERSRMRFSVRAPGCLYFEPVVSRRSFSIGPAVTGAPSEANIPAMSTGRERTIVRADAARISQCIGEVTGWRHQYEPGTLEGYASPQIR